MSTVTFVIAPEVAAYFEEKLYGLNRSIEAINQRLMPIQMNLKLVEVERSILNRKIEVLNNLLLKDAHERNFECAEKKFKILVSQELEEQVDSLNDYLDAYPYFVQDGEWIMAKKNGHRDKLIQEFRVAATERADAIQFNVKGSKDLNLLKSKQEMKIAKSEHEYYTIMKNRQSEVTKYAETENNQTLIRNMVQKLFLRDSNWPVNLIVDEDGVINPKSNVCYLWKPKLYEDINEEMLRTLTLGGFVRDVKFNIVYNWEASEMTCNDVVFPYWGRMFQNLARTAASQELKENKINAQKLLHAEYKYLSSSIGFYRLYLNGDMLLPVLCTNLKDLHLICCKNVDARTISQISKQCLHLQTLEISCCEDLEAIYDVKTTTFLSFNINHEFVPLAFPYLKEITIDNCKDLRWISLSVPEIISINISWNKQIRCVSIDSKNIKAKNIRLESWERAENRSWMLMSGKDFKSKEGHIEGTER